MPTIKKTPAKKVIKKTPKKTTPKKVKTDIKIDHEEMIKNVADKFHETAKELSALAQKIKGQYDTETNRKILAGVAAATVFLAGAALLKKGKKK